MNVLILGERKLLGNHKSAVQPNCKLITYQDDWKDLLDPVMCEDVFEHIDGIIHSGVSNYKYVDLSYEDLIIPLQSIIDHIIEAAIPIVYVSDMIAAHQSLRDNSPEYLHHLAERELYRARVEGADSWIIRPPLLIDEPSFLTQETLDSIDSTSSYFTTSSQKVLNRSIGVLQSVPESIVVSIGCEQCTGEHIIANSSSPSYKENKSWFRKKKEGFSITKYQIT